jgi:hypothetical protein
MVAKSKSTASLRLVTANSLTDGVVVFLGPDGQWTASIAESAAVATSAEAEHLLAIAKDSALRAEIVEPYIIEAERKDGVPVPERFRERIRVTGPTIQTPGS